MRTRTIDRALLPRLGLIAIAACLPALSQDTRGKILGRVTDSSGAVVPGVEVQAVNPETNVAFRGSTNPQGNFEIPYLQPGTYTLSAGHAGFKRYLRAGIELRANDELGFEILLEPGQVSETVTVTGASPILETSTSLGQVVDNQRITELPLSGGNPLTLTQLTPGVISFAIPNHPSLAPAVEVVSNIGVSGVRSNNTEFSIDGAPSMWGRSISFVPPPDLVGEFKVETARFDAAGRSPGGSVNLSLRSGTNLLHGTLSEHHSDNKLNSIDFFQRRFLYDASTGPVNDEKRKQVNPQFVINRFSATSSGPVVLPKVYDGRNRTFWIYGFDGLARPSQERGDYFHTVPTGPQRQGDFSGLLKLGPAYQIYDPATIAPAAGGRFSRLPLAGNIVPRSRIHPMAANFLPNWPESNLAGLANGENNHWGVLASYNEYFSHTARVDHVFSPTHRMFGRYNQAHQLFDSQATLPGTATGQHRNRYNKGFGLDDVLILSPQMLLNLRYSLSRSIQTTSPYSDGFDLVGAGFPAAFVAQLDPRAISFPQLAVGAYELLGNTQPTGSYINNHTWGADVTRMQGGHSLRAGWEFRLYRSSSRNLNFNTPRLEFGTTWTRGPLDNSAASVIGQDMASFLLGLPTGGQGQVNGSFAEQTLYTAGFVQDDWKVTPRLTVNLGLRWEYEVPATERFNRTTLEYDFNTSNPIEPQAKANYAANPIPQVAPADFKAVGGLTFAGMNGNPRALWRGDRNNWAPRAGFAWRMRGSTVLRMGYGVYYVGNGVDRTDVNQTGFTQSTTLVPSLDNGLTFVATIANPFPTGYQPALGAAGGLSTNLGRSIAFFQPERRHGFAQRWMASLQKQLPGQVALETAYVGTAGSRLDITRQWNPVPREYLSTSPTRDADAINLLTAQVSNPFYPALVGSDIGTRTVARSQLLRPYPHFNNISSVQQDGYSWYHSLQVRAQRRMRSGVTLQAGYTWSKFMEATGYLNPTDANPEYGISDQDRAHRFTASGIWELPFGRGRRFAGSWPAVPRYMVSGWQLSGVYQGQSGAPLGFGNILYYGEIGDIPLPRGERSVDGWFDTANFEKAAGRQLAQNIRTWPSRLTGLRGPGINLWNAAVLRTFRLSERWRLQFRSELLNATNHSFFGNPNMAPANAAFGTITATSGYPRQIYFALKLLW